MIKGVCKVAKKLLKCYREIMRHFAAFHIDADPSNGAAIVTQKIVTLSSPGQTLYCLSKQSKHFFQVQTKEPKLVILDFGTKKKAVQRRNEDKIILKENKLKQFPNTQEVNVVTNWSKEKQKITPHYFTQTSENLQIPTNKKCQPRKSSTYCTWQGDLP